MLRSKKRIVWAVLAALVFGGSYAARFLSQRARRHAEPEVVLPAFSEPPAGPRAPRSEGLGARVGRSTLADVEAAVKARGIACKDTSARALMKEMRAQKAKEGVDATSSASAKKTSPMERNPQVRLSCEETEASKLGDRARPAGVGRLLYVFDSPSHPLRHVSYRRVHADHAAARADLLDAIAAMKSAYGEPAATSGALPPEGGEFGKYEPYKVEWIWTDVRVTVSALSYGERGVDVYEAVEVPWPVRSDAPVL